MKKLILMTAIGLMTLGCEKYNGQNGDNGNDNGNDNDNTNQVDEFPEEAKFKLEFYETTPYGDIKHNNPSSFELISYRVVDIDGNYNAIMPKFVNYYDSLVVSLSGQPDQYCILRNRDKNGAYEFSSRFSTYYYEAGYFEVVTSGYKDGEVIYEHVLPQSLNERDFMCIDWENAEELLGKGSLSTYSIFDNSRTYKFLGIDKINDTYSVKGYTSAFPETPENELANLRWLMEEYLGAYMGNDASDFRTLPEDTTDESYEVIEVYESPTTRAAIIREENFFGPRYCFIAEGK